MMSLIFFLVAFLGWAILIGIIFVLSGLQGKIAKSQGIGSGIMSKMIKIPFIGTAEVLAVSGDEFTLKIKRKK